MVKIVILLQPMDSKEKYSIMVYFETQIQNATNVRKSTPKIYT